jgi:hypothetical protein
VLQGDWIDALPGLSERERQTSPDRLLATYLQSANPLKDAEAWTRPEHANLDATTLTKFLQGLGATPTATQLMEVAPSPSCWPARDGRVSPVRKGAAGGAARCGRGWLSGRPRSS